MKWKEILQDEWEIRPCWTGVDCWCRRICTKSGIIIVDAAYITKEMASYFVALHNKRLRDERHYYSNIHNIQYKKFEKIKFYDDDWPFEYDENGELKRDENDELIEIISPYDRMNTKWKVKKIGSVSGRGSCRYYIIITKEDHKVLDYILNEQQARYFVKLHNNFLKEKKKWQ